MKNDDTKSPNIDCVCADCVDDIFYTSITHYVDSGSIQSSQIITNRISD